MLRGRKVLSCRRSARPAAAEKPLPCEGRMSMLASVAVRILKSAGAKSAAAVILTLLPAWGYAQQAEIDRYVLYGGYTYFATPHLNLAERGFHLQAGVNLKTWLSAGFDYSTVSGHDSLTPNLLQPALQQELDGEIATLIALGQLPPGYQLSVVTNSDTQTFALGPQLEYRHFKPVTLFLRPSLGAVRQRATPRPSDPFAVVVVQQLLPSGSKLDWQGFYGVGGGFTWKATRHVGLRMQADAVYWNLYNDLLASGTWTVRYSVGPTFSFGHNIAAPAQ
jgi:hypothetical protein